MKRAQARREVAPRGARLLGWSVALAVIACAASWGSARGATVEPADSSSAPDSAGTADSLRAADSTGAATRAPELALPPRTVFNSESVLDTTVAHHAYARGIGIGRGTRTPVEALRSLPGVSIERFGFVGHSERILLFGDENVSPRYAGLPLLPVRSGLPELALLPGDAFQVARVRSAALDPLNAGRGASGSVDWSIAPGAEARAEGWPRTMLFAERGRYEFRQYRAAFDRWIGPVRASVAYQTARNRLFGEEDYARNRASYATIASSERSSLPILVSLASLRADADMRFHPGPVADEGRGTREHRVVVARTGARLGGLGDVRVAAKDDRIEWRTSAGDRVRGRERESGGQIVLAADRALSLAAWGYAGRIVDERTALAAATDRFGATLCFLRAGRANIELYGGGERVSPQDAREHAGFLIDTRAGGWRFGVDGHRAYDHPPRSFLVEGRDSNPARKTGLSAFAEGDSSSMWWRVRVLHRWASDGIFLRASDPFFADPLRATYRDWGASCEARVLLPLPLEPTLDGDYLFLDDDSEEALPLRAQHRGRAHASLLLADATRAKRLVLGGGVEIVGTRAAFDRVAELPASYDLRAFARVEIESATFFFEGDNLLDRFNDVLPGLLPEGRSLYFGVAWALDD